MASLTDRSIEIEQALLGTIIADSSTIDHLDGTVRPADFAEPMHAEIFSAMMEAREAGQSFNAALITSILGSWANEKLSGLGMSVGEYLATLMGASAGTHLARDYGRRLVDIAAFRRMSDYAQELDAKAKAASGRPGRVASELISQLDEVVSASISGSVKAMTVGDAAGAALEASKDRKEGKNDNGMPWPLADLNQATQGLHPGELTILAARPSMGKSTVGLSVATHLGLEGHGTLFVSLEMGAEALAERALSDICHRLGKTVPYTDIRSGDYEADIDSTLVEAYDMLRGAPLIIEQQGGLSVGQIASRARKAALKLEDTGDRLKCLVVDHLGLVAASSRYAGARHSELGEITSALKALAKELGIPVLLLCQLNRAVENRENKRPQLSDLRESGRIEEDADAVIFLYREAYYLERAQESDAAREVERHERLAELKNRLEINIAKQRQGPTKNISCFVSMPCNAIRDLEWRR